MCTESHAAVRGGGAAQRVALYNMTMHGDEDDGAEVVMSPGQEAAAAAAVVGFWKTLTNHGSTPSLPPAVPSPQAGPGETAAATLEAAAAAAALPAATIPAAASLRIAVTRGTAAAAAAAAVVSPAAAATTLSQGLGCTGGGGGVSTPAASEQLSLFVPAPPSSGRRGAVRGVGMPESPKVAAARDGLLYVDHPLDAAQIARVEAAVSATCTQLERHQVDRRAQLPKVFDGAPPPAPPSTDDSERRRKNSAAWLQPGAGNARVCLCACVHVCVCV